MKILVTGAAGYIGSVLVPELLKNDHDVIAVDNFMYNQTSLLDCCCDRKLAVIRGDARDKSLISKCLKDVDAILPLSCLTGAPLCEKYPFEAKTIIVDAIKMILDLRSKNQITIYPTTNSGYGIGQKDVFCTEETPLRPISLYGKLKVQAEEILVSAGNSIALRLATVFGVSPRMRLDLLVNDFTYRAVNDRFLALFESYSKRNYIHVRDVTKAFVHSLDNFDTMKDEVYNVGLSNANLSKWELCEEIKKQIPHFYFVEAKIGKDVDKRDYIVSNEKIEKTGFSPNVSLQEGIAELIKGYQIIKRNQYSNV
ncbi:MAG: NAD(P)-dependent oxidoreductase [Desulfobacteraceae bacterium]|nr:NAD(P)-dependent oxidoreductase [Desulfobacteraceae bacterium]